MEVLGLCSGHPPTGNLFLSGSSLTFDLTGDTAAQEIPPMNRAS